MKKDAILKIIDDVMNNREIDSIRNAIVAIRFKVIEFEDDENYDWTIDYVVANLGDWAKDYVADLGLNFEGANRVRIDTLEKIDNEIYGTISYYKK